jgi:hypothetical protein
MVLASNWSYMLFSNKSQITLLNADGRARVFRREDEIFVLNGMIDIMVNV